MTAFFQSEEEDCIANREHPYRSYVVGGKAYRFARHPRRHSVRACALTAVRGFNKFLKNALEAIVDAKMRRLERELRLHGVRYGPSLNQNRKRPPAARSDSTAVDAVIHARDAA